MIMETPNYWNIRVNSVTTVTGCKSPNKGFKFEFVLRFYVCWATWYHEVESVFHLLSQVMFTIFQPIQEDIAYTL